MSIHSKFPPLQGVLLIVRESKKQWKDQLGLGKWQFRKRLNARDAAYICQQLRANDSDGTRQRRVFFNETEVTLENVQQYIRKSTKIHSEEALMSYHLEDTAPLHITVEFVDTPARLSGDSFVPVTRDSPAASEPIVSEEPGSDDEDPVLLDEDGTSDRDSSFDVPQIWTDMEPDVAAIGSQWGFVNVPSVLSCSSVQLSVDPGNIDKRIDQWLCSSHVSTVGDTGQHIARVRRFLSHCCAVAIYSHQENQVFDQRPEASKKQAILEFNDILAIHPWDSLSTLNNMIVLLSLYGHSYVPHDLLLTISYHVSAQIRDSQSSPPESWLLVLASALRCWTQLPYSEQIKPEYDLNDLAKMVGRAEESFPKGQHEHFQITAAYVHAWALLEMKQSTSALAILKNFEDQCISVFGSYKFQTINWIGTLARAQAACGNRVVAHDKYETLMTSRIKEVFTEEHPQYWDGKYRLACYYSQRINDISDVQEKRSRRFEVAKSLQETLLWRNDILGPLNPITLQNYRALRRVLRKLGLAEVNSSFDEVMFRDLKDTMFQCRLPASL